MKFITFGCWNKGSCSMDTVEDPISAVMQHVKNEISKNKYDFMILSGDNYYPEKINKNKIFNEDNLKSGFDCLSKIPIKKYIINGNHEYGDIYKNSNFPSSVNPKEFLYCQNIKYQLEYSRLPNFNFFKNVMIMYEDKTLVIMIDTTIYDELKDEELSCYDGIFGMKINLEYIKKDNNKNKIINKIKEKQLEQVIDIFNSPTIIEKEIQNLIFVGHHPIINCRNKKSKDVFNVLDDLKNFFNNVFDYLTYKAKNIKIAKIVYLCADTHFYQKGIVSIKNAYGNTYPIEQHIVGTGGATCDTICPNSREYSNLLGDIDYIILDQKQEYGYLKYDSSDNGTFLFQSVPFNLAYYTVINGIIKLSENIKSSDDKKLCQNEGSRKYEIEYKLKEKS